MSTDDLNYEADWHVDEIQRSQGKSLLEILGRSAEVAISDHNTTRNAVIGKALNILSQTHSAFVTPVEDRDEVPQAAADDDDPNLEDARRRRMLHALLDLISLEGIYPSLSSGVGIPLQQRVISVLPAGVIAKQTHIPETATPRNEELLSRIMNALLNILSDTRPSIQPVIRGRILSDIISGTADLGFNPSLAASEQKIAFQDDLIKILNEYVHAIW